jgi:hypothetical protein
MVIFGLEILDFMVKILDFMYKNLSFMWISAQKMTHFFLFLYK